MRNRKDSKPEETIQKIKEILSEVGLDTHITEAYNNEMCYSYRVELSDFPGIGTNGKGITEEYALASAYGELMERLQNGALIDFLFPYKERERQSGKFEEDLIYDFCSYYDHIDSKIRTDLKNFFSSHLYLCEGRWYADIVNDKSVYLPFKLIDILCGTNGLCAGNTLEEAVVQGTEEILERAVLKFIFFEPRKAYHEIKVLPLRAYESLEIYEVVKMIEKKGYVCSFLDCTMGGKLPVIALILYDRKRVRYKFSIGSDVDLQIAMQRCITEIFQGHNFNSLFRLSMNPIFDLEQVSDTIFELQDMRGNFEKCAISGSGQLPPYIFLIKTPSNEEWNFDAEIHSNKDAFEYLKLLVSGLGYSLLVQDNSYLGFPAYQVFIPGMSEMFDDFESRRMRDECMEEMHAIDKGNKEQLILLIEKLERLKHYNSTGEIADIAGIVVKKDDGDRGRNSLSETGQFMLCCLYYACERYEDAYRYYSDYKNHVCSAPMIYLKLKSLHYEEEAIQEIFLSVGIEFNAREYFNYEFPQCPDCSLCRWSEVCKYEEWRKLRDMLVQRRNQF